MDSGLANLILFFHLAYVLFVVLGLGVVWLGYWRRWAFVKNFWFRFVHLLAMGYVVMESLMGVTCPLTLWENQLRLKAGHGQIGFSSFGEYWVHRLMYYNASPTTFTVIYVIFFTGMLLSWVWIRPQGPSFGG